MTEAYEHDETPVCSCGHSLDKHNDECGECACATYEPECSCSQCVYDRLVQR